MNSAQESCALTVRGDYALAYDVEKGRDTILDRFWV